MSARGLWTAAAWATVLTACGTGGGADGNTSPRVLVDASLTPDAPAPAPAVTRLALIRPEALADAVASATEDLPADRVVSAAAQAPAGDTAPDTYTVTIEADPTCAACYRFDDLGTSGHLKAGAPLGVITGLAELLERHGLTFLHPFHTTMPAQLTVPEPLIVGRSEPRIPRRGLHLHTLHPIEALDAFWMPGETERVRARAICRWIARNGGNYVQWAALNNIEEGSAADSQHAAWVSHTNGILDDAHRMGMQAGLGIELFGQSNLQRAYDLIDDPDEVDSTVEDQVGAAMDRIAGPVQFDLYNLSFGEFISSDPQLFVDSVNLAWNALHTRLPNAEMSTTIHVGNRPEQHVTYRGQEMLYYFLAQFADPAVVPWIHTVMFYNLYDPTGGAYGHDAFTEHRTFAEDRLRQGLPVGYLPESAYWIAFDDAIPQYLPVYVTSRLMDLERLGEIGPLTAHVIFSTGWEWGYWQNDRAALRASFRGEGTAEEAFTDDFGSPTIGAAVARLAEAQRQTLILDKTAAYTAGRDFYVDAGDMTGIIAAPDRWGFGELAMASEAERTGFVDAVLTPLETLRTATLEAESTVLGALPGGDPDALVAPLDELRDGLRIDVLRLDFVLATWHAVLAHGAGEAAAETDAVTAADAALTEAQTVADRRHAALLDADDPLITMRWRNPTIYAFGYLFHTTTLCHWQRERQDLQHLLTGIGGSLPTCAL